ncbi:MAG: hypothetical protein IJ532_05595 [Alphaproteobacteria bacterium]|nr:hypothetical protein [Alphaproteobacteria bacterium]
MSTKGKLKAIGVGIVAAVLTSCSDGKEKQQQQDNEQKNQTEQVMDSQKTIQELTSNGIPVLKAGKKGNPDSLLYSVEKEEGAYSNPKYEATSDVSKAPGIEPLSYEITEMKINRKDAQKVFGEHLGEVKVGDVFKINGHVVKVSDDNAQNSFKMKIRYGYRDIAPDKENAWDFNLGKEKYVSEFGEQADKADKWSGEWKVYNRLDKEYKAVNEKSLYEDEVIETPFEVKGSTVTGGIHFEVRGAKYNFGFGDLSKANIVRDAKLPKKPKAPKRKIGEAMFSRLRTLADVKKCRR